MKKILILGAAGKTGMAFLRKAAQSNDFFIESVIRDENKHSMVDKLSSKVSCFDYIDDLALERSVRNTDILYLALPRNDDEIQYAERILQKARQCHVTHIIYLSTIYNKEKAKSFSHSKKTIENIIKDIGCTYTILKPNFFMSRFMYLPKDLLNNQINLVSTVSKHSAVTFIDVVDIAQFAFQSISNKKMHNIEAVLTGSTAYSINEITQQLSNALGTSIIHTQEDEDRYSQRLKRLGYSALRITQQIQTFRLWREGQCELYSPDFTRFMGHPTSDFPSYIKRNINTLQHWSDAH